MYATFHGVRQNALIYFRSKFFKPEQYERLQLKRSELLLALKSAVGLKVALPAPLLRI